VVLAGLNLPSVLFRKSKTNGIVIAALMPRKTATITATMNTFFFVDLCKVLYE
jgi:hypothetical protein